jgi:hypothetical protein
MRRKATGSPAHARHVHTFVRGEVRKAGNLHLSATADKPQSATLESTISCTRQAEKIIQQFPELRHTISAFLADATGRKVVAS